MAKYENIRALAKKQLQAVTESSDRWKAFLRTAAIAYNYSFPNQLLIHEQSPTATAVADIAYWNNNAGRWVKRGAHGIAVFDTRANSSRLRYLFDISDTIPRAEIPEALPWVITDQNWRPVWDKIVADNHADSIQSALLMLSTSCVAQRSAMFTTALGKAIDGSSLQWAKPDEQRQLFLQLITQSCLYMAALRCGVDTARLDLSALESVNQFDTNRITLCLGSACQQAARPLMQQIGSITREIDSVARAEKVRYYGDKQEETNNTKEVNNGVHDGERLPNPGADAERAADAGNRQVRQLAAQIPAGERADGVRRDAAGGNAVPASGGDGQRSTPANRADDADADAAEHRPEPADRPDGLDAVDERLAGPSRGTGDAADLQPVTQEPQAESDTTPSAFSVPISDLPPLSDELILGLLAKESSSRADNAAILEYFNEHPDLAERSAFCKHCYKQIYTYLFVDDHTVGFIRHDMYLELWEGNYLTKTAQVNLTWDAVAAKIADLIEQGRLMVPIKAAPVQQQMEQLKPRPPSKLSHTVRDAPGNAVAGKIHQEIQESEDDNVGVESAHKSEEALETGVHLAREGYRSHKLKPYRQAAQAERKLEKANVNALYQKSLQENPQLASNPLSRWQQKQQIKKQYAAAKRAAQSGGSAAGAAQKTGKAAKTVKEKAQQAGAYVMRHKKGFGIALALFLIVCLLLNTMSSCSMMAQSIGSMISGTTYPSDDPELVAVEADYAAKEAALQAEIDNIESSHPGYDEYRYDLDMIGHDPHELAAYLSAVLQGYTRASAQAELERIFAAQYQLTLTEEVEVRYRTETRTDSEGNEYDVEVPYNYYILNVTLTSKPISSVASELLTPDQLEMYQVYRQTLGNKPLIFGGGSADTSDSESLAGVEFVNGTRPGNQAVVDIAKSQVGNVGGQPYWSWYGFNSRVEWCACFVSWCYGQMGLSEPRFAACQSQGIPWFQSHGQWGGRDYANIAPGDAIFFDWDLDGSADHVGIVVGTDGSRVYTVEGNSGDACKIKSYSLTYECIKGYGLMNW